MLIAPGTVDQMNRFLDAWPSIPRGNAFVDSSADYEAYGALGIPRLGSGPSPEGVNLNPPGLELGEWLSYFRDVVTLSPIRKDEEGVPAGVKLLGGTFVLKEKEIVYASADRIPGDYPSPDAVLRKIESVLQ